MFGVPTVVAGTCLKVTTSASSKSEYRLVRSRRSTGTTEHASFSLF